MAIPREAVEAGWHASERTTRSEVERIIAAALPHILGQRDGKREDLPEEPRPRQSMTIVASRDGRTIRWKCVDISELRQRTAAFLAQGYTLA
jgi:hypothetical protein